MSMVLAFERGRSKNFNVLRQIRKAYVFALARNVRLHFRWIMSEMN